MNSLTTVSGVQTLELIQSSVSPNTYRAYRQALAQLDAWRGERLISDSVMAEYVSYLHEGGKSPSTIAIAVAAVRCVAKRQGVAVLGIKTEDALKGARRNGRSRGRGQVDGLDWVSVEIVCKMSIDDGTLAGLRDAALIRVMSDALLRISEAVAIDVEHLRPEALFVPFSKTDAEGKGVHLYISEPTGALIERYLCDASVYEGAVFRRIRRGGHVGEARLSTESARRIICKRAKDAGMVGLFSGHSLRIGAAVSLAHAGATVPEMQVAGRWEDPRMPAHYAGAELAKQGAVAKYRYRKEEADER